MAPRRAHSLATLLVQVNELAPGRSKTKGPDGWIGDARHRTTNSLHNPNRLGHVRAQDLSHDPPRFDSYKLAETLRINKDSRIDHVISAGKIFSSTVKPWTWRAYNGKNSHHQHVHVGVRESQSVYDDPRPWNLDGGPLTSAPPDSTPPTLWRNARGNDVKKLQQLLNGLRSKPVTVDGDFGKETEAAVRAFQKSKGLVVDGVAGVNTWLALLSA